MKYKIIDSKENKNYKFFKNLFNKKYRDRSEIFIIEGKKLLLEAINENVNIQNIICTKDFFEEFKFDFLNSFLDKVIILKDNLFFSLSEMTNSEGVISTVKYLNEKNITTDNILCLDGVSDPGNFGTIIRTANAFGIKDILILNTVDKYNSKVLRATMGAIFRTNIVKIEFDTLYAFKKTGYKIVSTTLNDKSKSLEKFDFKGKNIIVMGNEANGVSKEILNISDEFLKIDMNNSMESLNVSVASAVIMYKIFKR
ncbi:MAG: RNA methyltransferase [Parvimonas sp.]|uniref:TrmH family RNA methyltransferase n=1 Tax=Parvimonas sp. TaxID=1944660 RepID=UPI002A75A9EC|nr:RNA methyltransferase [Parvimonas sp.]MDY3050618.1 RNA methyltransferase [Parvimonas sp.]